MCLFVNPIKAMFGTASIDMQSKFHRTKFPERQLMSEAKAIWKAHGAEEELGRRLKRDIKRGLVEAIRTDEENELAVIDNIRNQLRHCFADVVMISHIQLDTLKELLETDQDLKKRHFPADKADDMIAKIIQEIDDMRGVLDNAAGVLKQ